MIGSSRQLIHTRRPTSLRSSVVAERPDNTRKLNFEKSKWKILSPMSFQYEQTSLLWSWRRATSDNYLSLLEYKTWWNLKSHGASYSILNRDSGDYEKSDNYTTDSYSIHNEGCRRLHPLPILRLETILRHKTKRSWLDTWIWKKIRGIQNVTNLEFELPESKPRS